MHDPGAAYSERIQEPLVARVGGSRLVERLIEATQSAGQTRRLGALVGEPLKQFGLVARQHEGLEIEQDLQWSCRGQDRGHLVAPVRRPLRHPQSDQFWIRSGGHGASLSIRSKKASAGGGGALLLPATTHVRGRSHSESR